MSVWCPDKAWSEKTAKLYQYMVDDVHKIDTDTKGSIVWACAELCAMLLTKNENYGNSALAPDPVFAKGMKPSDMIRIRIDDKLKRLKYGHTTIQEDTELDLMGYLVLLRIAKHNETQDEFGIKRSLADSSPPPEEPAEARPVRAT